MRHALGSTGSFTEVLTLSTFQLEADYDHPVTHEDLARVLEEETEPVNRDQATDLDLRGSDPFAF